MHEEETLRKLLKTGRNSANKETPLHANKAVKVLLPVFLQTTSTCMKQGFLKLATTKTSMLVAAIVCLEN